MIATALTLLATTSTLHSYPDHMSVDHCILISAFKKKKILEAKNQFPPQYKEEREIRDMNIKGYNP